MEVPDTFLWLTEADVCSLIDLGGGLNVTGHQVPPQVAAAVRGRERVRVFGPTPENRGKFVDLLKSKYGFEVA